MRNSAGASRNGPSALCRSGDRRRRLQAVADFRRGKPDWPRSRDRSAATDILNRPGNKLAGIFQAAAENACVELGCGVHCAGSEQSLDGNDVLRGQLDHGCLLQHRSGPRLPQRRDCVRLAGSLAAARILASVVQQFITREDAVVVRVGPGYEPLHSLGNFRSAQLAIMVFVERHQAFDNFFRRQLRA